MNYPKLRMKFVLAANDGGAWGEEPEAGAAIPVLRSTEITLAGNIEPDGAALRTLTPREVRATRLNVGDILVVKSSGSDAHLGKSGWVDERCAGMSFSNFIQRLRVSKQFDPRYTWYFMNCKAMKEQVRLLSSTTTGLQNLSGSLIREIEVPAPPLDKQRRITYFLDAETARIDGVIAAKQRMVAVLEERLRAARIDLAIDRYDPIRQDGPAWLGSIPRAWQLARLKFAARMDSGHTPNRQVDAYWVNCTIPWITLNDVSRLEDAWRFLNPTNFVNELGLQNSSAHVLPADAVVMSRDATVGRSAILGKPMAVSQHFVAWICGPKLLPEYLLNVIRGPMQYHFGSLTAGATIATIGMPDLNQLVVPVPPISEQARIVEKIADVEKVAVRTIDVIRRQIVLLQEHRQALITAAVTGQLEIPEAA